MSRLCLLLRTLSTLKKDVELCEYNKFCKIELPNEGKNFKQHTTGAKSLKMNSVIYADLKSILVPYSTCDKEDITIKTLNKHVPCGYSLNVVTNHDKQTKQTHYRGDNVVATICKEVRDRAQDLINIEKKPMQK